MDFINPQDGKKIFVFHASINNRIIARESSWLEFKESFNWLSKGKYAKSERIKYPELKLLLDQIKTEERKSWMEHFEKISKIGPTNAAIFDIVGGEISGCGGTLVIDKKLCRTRYLDPNNPKSSKKDFYSPEIYKKFDKHYNKK